MFDLDLALDGLGVYLLALIALIAVEVLMGVAAAIKKGEFDIKKLSQFYIRTVVPHLIGYVALCVLARFALPDVLGDFGYLASDAIKNSAWAIIVATLAGSILVNAKVVFGPRLKPGG